MARASELDGGALIGGRHRGHGGPVHAVGATLGFVRKKPVGAVAALLIAAVVFTGIFANLIAPHNPLVTSPIDSLRSPSGKFLLGTDVQGRDIFSRILFGARISIGVGV